jgi:hypothetical protein
MAHHPRPTLTPKLSAQSAGPRRSTPASRRVRIHGAPPPTNPHPQTLCTIPGSQAINASCTPAVRFAPPLFPRRAGFTPPRCRAGNGGLKQAVGWVQPTAPAMKVGSTHPTHHFLPQNPLHNPRVLGDQRQQHPCRAVRFAPPLFPVQPAVGCAFMAHHPRPTPHPKTLCTIPGTQAINASSTPAVQFAPPLFPRRAGFTPPRCRAGNGGLKPALRRQR